MLKNIMTSSFRTDYSKPVHKARREFGGILYFIPEVLGVEQVRLPEWGGPSRQKHLLFYSTVYLKYLVLSRCVCLSGVDHPGRSTCYSILLYT
jgi:hypothetical protein